MSINIKKFVIPITTHKKEETIEFYKILGFVCYNKDTFFNGNFFLNIYEKDAYVVKGLSDNMQHNNLFLFSMQIEDLETFKRDLLTHKISIERIDEIPIGEYITIKDPNGYKIVIYELYI